VIIEPIDGGVTAPQGFRSAGVACGIKREGLDLALIVADRPASAAALFTTSRAVAAPVIVSREHLERSSGTACAVVANSGCANACTGQAGLAAAREMAGEAAGALGCAAEQVIVASTGVIGVSLDIGKVKTGIGRAAACLSRDHHLDTARAIMTTDPWPKESAVSVRTAAGSFSIGGIAKGAGMIEPAMATMLAFLTTDAQVAPSVLRRALVEAAQVSFNAITVDGDMSTNDTFAILAGSASGVNIDETTYPAFADGLKRVCQDLALKIVRGGEGATKLVSVRVTGASSTGDARQAARTIANSLLVKTALHGGDPNWGRLVAAAGRAGVPFDIGRALVKIGPTVLFRNGQPFDEAAPLAAEYLRGRDIEIAVDLGAGGEQEATVWTCDLSADYVRINAEYRT
jgi:glutamate N-acetyltransferase/amino-acid N-acetyltransferase